MPVWLQNEGAWIAIGVSVLFVVAGFVMHRVVMKVLKAPAPEVPSDTHSSERSQHEQQQS